MASAHGAEADPEQRPRLLGQVDAAAGHDLHVAATAAPPRTPKASVVDAGRGVSARTGER